MLQLQQVKEQLERLGISVYIITFDSDQLAKAYVEQTDLPWPMLIDGERSVYDAYHMKHGSWWAIMNPVSIWGYIKLMLQGRRPGKSGKDYKQLGGDVLIDPKGEVVLHHASTGPHDRAGVESLLERVGGIAQ